LTYFVEKLDGSPAVLARLRAPVASAWAVCGTRPL
jgi:hypothetical protein